MQQRLGAAEQLRPACEQQPLGAMAFVRAAAPTECIWAIPVILEAVERPATEWTFDGRTTVSNHVEPQLDTAPDPSDFPPGVHGCFAGPSDQA
jgi:hypothetical protein